MLKEPVGPVAAFTPWNFPINQVVRKVGAALATGCSILVKAPEETPASPAALIQAFVDAGVPAGVVGLVYGDPAEISSYLIPHPVIRKITFTGSTPVGKQLAALAGQHMKRVTMELGGHAPVIVAEDADVALAVKAARRRQVPQRRPGLHLADALPGAQEHRARVRRRRWPKHAEGLKVGDGLAEGTHAGPAGQPAPPDAMAEFTEDAVQAGRQGAHRRRAHRQRRQLLAADRADRRAAATPKVFNDEPFGPMAAIRGFDTLDEAIAEANRLPYRPGRLCLHQVAEERRPAVAQASRSACCGSTSRRCPRAEMPFGGVKDSGYGSEGGPEAMEAYLNARAVAILNV